MHDFTDTNVLITGGTRGIGRSMVDAFAEAGANVAFTFRSSTDEAEAITKELSDAGVDAFRSKAMPLRWRPPRRR